MSPEAKLRRFGSAVPDRRMSAPVELSQASMIAGGSSVLSDQAVMFRCVWAYH